MGYRASGAAVAALAIAAGFGGMAQAAPAFVNGGFEAGASSGWDLMTATNTPGWTIGYGSNSTFPRLNLNQANGGPYGANNQGAQFATIGGFEDGGTSSLSQTVSGFNPGQTYTLSWIQASEFTASDALQVSFVGSSTPTQVVTSAPYPGNSQFWYSWQTESVNFVPTAGSVTFTFNSFGSNYEPGVDNFQISGGGGVPEPATWAMLLVGFAALGVAVRGAKQREELAATAI